MKYPDCATCENYRRLSPPPPSRWSAQLLIQVAVILLTAAIAWGVQRGQVDSLQVQVNRVTAEQQLSTERHTELVRKIEGLTVEVKYLREGLGNGRIHGK